MVKVIIITVIVFWVVIFIARIVPIQYESAVVITAFIILSLPIVIPLIINFYNWLKK